MPIVCMWCKETMGPKGAPGELASHGICRVCWKKHYPDIEPGEELEASWRKLEETNS